MIFIKSKEFRTCNMSKFCLQVIYEALILRYLKVLLLLSIYSQISLDMNFSCYMSNCSWN